MIFDKQSLFCENQLLNAAAVISTNSIDLRANGTVWNGTVPLSRDATKSNDIPLLVQITEAVNNAVTLRAELQNSDDPTFATSTVVTTSPEVPIAQLKPGYRFVSFNPIPEGVTGRYIRMRFVATGGTVPTSGKITAGIVMSVQTNA